MFNIPHLLSANLLSSVQAKVITAVLSGVAEKKRAGCQDMLFPCQSAVKNYEYIGKTRASTAQQAANVRVCRSTKDSW